VAALFNPMTNEMLMATKGGGATLNNESIRAMPTCGLEGCGLIVRPEIHDRLRKNPLWPVTRILTPIPSSIAYRLALVAMGRWDAAIGLQGTNDWDVAAALLIVEEAGGVVTDGEGAAFAFNQAVTRHPGVVAAGAGLHPLLMDRLMQMSRPS
jgi:myo-inositol-1(or 4)-monophosphatase